jgi:hypothetical protein
LVIEWQEGESAKRLQLRTDGRVLSGERSIGQFEGSCLLDEEGGIRFLVDDTGAVTMPDQARLGAFRAQNTLRVGGETVTLSEVLARVTGDASAVDDTGTVYSISAAADAVTMPAHVDGDISHARRAALLLLEARPGFGRP